MRRSISIFSLALLVCLLAAALPAARAADEPAPSEEAQPTIGISKELGDAIANQASQVKTQFETKARLLFQRAPLGFDWQTAEHIYQLLIETPAKIPQLMNQAVEQTRLLGVVGSALIALFIMALVYSVFGQRRVMARIEGAMQPLTSRVPDSIYRYVLPAIRVVIAALLPIILFAAYAAIHALITYEAQWFILVGRLIRIWAIAALVIGLLRQMLVHDLFTVTKQHGKKLFRVARLVVIYCTLLLIAFRTAQSLGVRQDVLALLQFVISISIVLALFLLMLKKKALMSLLPDLPHRSYQRFSNLFQRFYIPIVLLSLVLALLWSIGYRTLGRVLLVKIWASAGAYIAIMVIYHLLRKALELRHAKADTSNEAAVLVYKSLKSLLVYCTTIASVLVVLNLLGLLGLIEQAMSFPVFQMGKTAVTLWIIVKAGLIITAFVFLSRLSQAYLDYRVYPAVGIEPGLGYALNTSLKYMMLGIGVLVALNVVGLDLKFLLVFAGAIGIGVGMGMQNIIGNVISGFTIIFGGKLRKGDWIEVGGTMGVVTDIYLRATKVRTRDDIEYLIPNSEFISGVLVNYSLGSPLIRIDVPVGVTYSADPRQVEQILLDVAKKEPLVHKRTPPTVRFVEFGDSSINFQLLIWIDVRKTPRRLVRSNLYFAIFEALDKAGIEIPFPQRDIHVRSMVPPSTEGES